MHRFTNLLLFIAALCFKFKLASAEFASVSLTGRLAGTTLEYRLNPEDELTGGRDSITIRFTVPESCWLAVGVSPNGGMINSEAVIAKPEERSIRKYRLSDRSTSAITELPRSRNLYNATFAQSGGITILTFTKLLVEDGELTINGNGSNNFIAAFGSSNTFGFHEGYGSTVITLSLPTPTDAPTLAPQVAAPIFIGMPGTPQPPPVAAPIFIGMPGAPQPPIVPSPTIGPAIPATEVPAPTDAPVPAPTNAPVPAPTNAPVPAPTNAPVPAPTNAPVPAPTNAPVPAPTNAPVPPPTNAPVPPPTDAPIPAPTNAPVPAPTNAPVPPPTDAPIPVPAPTNVPVLPPTTDAPLSVPTNAPVPAPTDAPVPAPTDAPAAPPINSPVPALTDAPVPAPTNSPVPSSTDAPVAAPIDSPVTAVPVPTDAPVAAPTDGQVPTDDSAATAATPVPAFLGALLASGVAMRFLMG